MGSPRLVKGKFVRWQLRQVFAINLIAAVAVGFYVLLRAKPLVPAVDLVVLLAIVIHSGLLVWKLGHRGNSETAFLYTLGFTRDQVWWHTLLASFISALIICAVAWLLVVTGLRSSVQDRWVLNPYYPWIASLEYAVMLQWLLLYAFVLPLMHYAWVRASQPYRGAASGWVLLVLGLTLLAWTIDQTSHTGQVTSLSAGALLTYLPPAVLMLFAGWRLHGTMEVRS